MAETGAMTATQAVPLPRKHRHRYLGVFAPNHKLRSAVTALAIGNVGKRRDAASDGHAVGGHAAGRGLDSSHYPRLPHDPPHSRSTYFRPRIHARPIR